MESLSIDAHSQNWDAKRGAAEPLLAGSNSTGDDLSYPQDWDGKSTTWQAWCNLANAIVGAAFLALPFAFTLVGIGPALVMVAVVVGVNLYSAHLLLGVARVYGATNYEQLARQSDGNPGLNVLAAFQAIFTFTVEASYVSLIVSCTGPSVVALRGSAGLGVAVWVAMLVLCLALSFVRRISSLAYASLGALLLLVVAIGCVAYQLTQGLPRHVAEDLPSKPGARAVSVLDLATAFGIISFAFTAQHLCFQVANSLPRREGFTPALGVLNLSTATAAVISTAFGILGYAAFARHPGLLEYNFLDSYATAQDSAPPAIAVAKLAVALSLALTYPAEFLVTRHTIRMVMDQAYIDKLFIQLGRPQALAARASYHRHVWAEVFDPQNRRSWRLHVLLTVIIWMASLLPGIWTALLEHPGALALLMQVPGPVSAAGLACLLPALIHLKLGFDPDEDRSSRCSCTGWNLWLSLSAALLVFGGLAVVAAIVALFNAKVLLTATT